MADQFSFGIFADAYLNDAKTLIQYGQQQTFNVSSIVDDGSLTLIANPIDMTAAKHPATGVSGTLHFVLGHAIELYLKSILLGFGVEEQRLHKLGHNLTKIVSEVEGFDVEVTDKNLIVKFSPSHKKMDYRYPKKARTEFLNPSGLSKVAQNLSALAKKYDKIH